MTVADPWAIGAAVYDIDKEIAPGQSLVVGVRCRFGDLEAEDLALLDTGGQWSVIGGELGEILEADLGDAERPLTMSTRYGSLNGTLHRIVIHLTADRGDCVSVEASVVVIPDWPGPPVLGYRGFLERLRFALDPGCWDGNQWFYFGEPDDEVGPHSALLGG